MLPTWKSLDLVATDRSCLSPHMFNLSMTESVLLEGCSTSSFGSFPGPEVRCKPPVNFRPRLDDWMTSYWSLLASTAPQLTGHAPTFAVELSLNTYLVHPKWRVRHPDLKHISTF